MDVVELVPSVSFSPRTNLYGRMSGDVTFKVWLLLYVKKVIVTSGLINREMTKTGQAAGLSGSHPLGYIITDLENQLSLRFVPYYVCFGMSTVADHNRKVMIYSVHSSWVSGRSCVGRVARCSCWTPVYLSLEVHWSGGSSLPCHSMESILHYVLYGFDCAQLCGNVRCKHSCYFIYLL